jgi:predicted HicB family RNase H-like nuclease
MKKKDLNYYLSLPYTTVVEKRDDGRGPYYVARVLELPHCLIHGDTPEEAVSELASVKRDWLEDCLERGVHIPEPEKQEYSGELRLRMPPSLHRRLAIVARKEGVSLNSYLNSILSGSVRFTGESSNKEDCLV